VPSVERDAGARRAQQAGHQQRGAWNTARRLRWQRERQHGAQRPTPSIHGSARVTTSRTSVRQKPSSG
jgi:hypothetical protein